MVDRYDGIRMSFGEDTFQDIFRVRPQKNSNIHLIQVEDEISFPEYVDVSDDAKNFILKIMKKKP